MPQSPGKSTVWYYYSSTVLSETIDGTPGPGTFRNAPSGTLERLSHVFGIYKSLRILLPAAAAATWVRRPNDAPLFAGRPAIELMTSGVAGLFLARAYLDAERGGDFA